LKEDLQSCELRSVAFEGQVYALTDENRVLREKFDAKSLDKDFLNEQLQAYVDERDNLQNDIRQLEVKLSAADEMIQSFRELEEKQTLKISDLTGRIEILETTISLLEASKLGLEQQVSSIEGTF
jgi:predicted nuclease with TOPRIM domain